MADNEVLVTFRPSGTEARVPKGTRLADAAAQAGLLIETPCGGEGICGRCRVVVSMNPAAPTAIECDHLSLQERNAGWRLACQTIVQGHTEVHLPSHAPTAEHQILAKGVESPFRAMPSEKLPHDIAHPHQPSAPPHDPPIEKRYVEIPHPTRHDDVSDVLRLEQALGAQRLTVDLPLLQELPKRLRDAHFCATAVVSDHRLLDVEPGNTVARAFAVAFDIGTTTIVGTLLDLRSGEQWAVASRLNPQTRYGDDVLTRILHARKGHDEREQLRESVAAAIDEMIGELCEKADVSRHHVYEASFAGNTTMQQLFCGIDSHALGEVPFVAATSHALHITASRLGLHIHPQGRAYLMPTIGGFVGGDTSAGILATEIARAQGPTLLVDIGTNGEIVLQIDGQLTAASTAAGPAFEGARISCGMRGCTGAIEKVTIEKDPNTAERRLQLQVIGNVQPVGLCGSGLIDIAAELLRHGILTPQGRLLPPDELPPDTPPDLARRVVQQEGRTAFVLATPEQTGDRPILLTQRDLRELQLATGAIRAGIALLLHRAGLKPDALQHVLIGGGFGNFIRRSNAQRIGLLPTELDRQRIFYMGNTSLAGIQRAALSLQARHDAETLARRTKHVDLSTDPEFQNYFADCMIFPD
jgi:uncharacterized 2Fe-2S/4Fe-4S cluster protein (DUF4445 family)